MSTGHTKKESQRRIKAAEAVLRDVLDRMYPKGKGLKLAFATCEAGEKLDAKWHISGVSAISGEKVDCDIEIGDWADNDALKGFSGEAVYTAKFDWAGEGEYAIDLGKVGDYAEIVLNGVELGAVGAAPFMKDISKALVKGENVLEVRVTNTLRNVLVATDAFKGGRMMGPGPRELAMSGICGPVEIKKI